MKGNPYIKTKRGFVRERRKSLKIAKKAISDLRRGCAAECVYGKDVHSMLAAVAAVNDAIRRIDEITKAIAK